MKSLKEYISESKDFISIEDVKSGKYDNKHLMLKVKPGNMSTLVSSKNIDAVIEKDMDPKFAECLIGWEDGYPVFSDKKLQKEWDKMQDDADSDISRSYSRKYTGD